MTTIVDPLGTPAIFYNRSGTTFIPITPNGTTPGGVSVITALTKMTVVLMNATSGHDLVKLPDDGDAIIGDKIEVQNVGTANGFVLKADGSAVLTSIGVGEGLTLRKIASDTWRGI
jgi:hypothetical protein